MANEFHWTYAERVKNTVDKIAQFGAAVPEEHREDYLRVQVGLAIGQAFRNGRAGVSDADLVLP